MQYPDARIIVFTKAPVAGEVKTRLVPPLTHAQAAELHARLVHRTLAMATGAALAPVELHCTPSRHHAFFENCRRQYAVTLHDQQGADLGKRMHNAFSDTLKSSACALLIGTDCPTLHAADLEAAIDGLRSGADAVLNPARDGGYALIGLRRPATELFTGIAWSTWTVMHETRTRLQQLGWRWTELDTKWDLDRPADLARLDPAEFPLAIRAMTGRYGTTRIESEP
ncbi:MAG: hypothetical protein FD165_2117 [Gammaproteobacteria bacterium]|nr:MAG: hypothetical protein FD165_2117 [Gammaproteobacteria bacterium]TND05277.1 MAG: hypothetical protein FD120_1152 [Gammaproteobacteria bacterium]